MLVAPIVKMCGEEGRVDVQTWESIELILSDCLGVDHDDSGLVEGVRVASGPFQCIEHVISRSVSVAVSVDIHIPDDQGLEQGSQQGWGWEVVSPADLGTARSSSIISVISQVFRVTSLWHPVRLGQQSSVALDRTIKDKLDSSGLVPGSVVIFQSPLESTEVWTFLEEVPIDINGKTISKSVISLSK